MGQGLEGWIFDPSQGRKLWEELLQTTCTLSLSGGAIGCRWKGAWVRQLLSPWGVMSGEREPQRWFLGRRLPPLAKGLLCL